jgi:hypothetical protein
VSEFVDECRREWRRLGVPEPDANEMAADLTADLKEAEQDGVAAEEVLGSGAFDPRAFAASWASERGLIRTRWHDGMRNHRLLVAVAGLVVLLAAAGVTAGFLVSWHGSHPVITDVGTARQPTRTVPEVAIPDVIGLQQEEAISVAQTAGLQVRVTVRVRKTTSAGTVLNQTPTAGTTAGRGSTIVLVVAHAPAHAKRR